MRIMARRAGHLRILKTLALPQVSDLVGDAVFFIGGRLDGFVMVR